MNQLRQGCTVPTTERARSPSRGTYTTDSGQLSWVFDSSDNRHVSIAMFAMTVEKASFRMAGRQIDPPRQACSSTTTGGANQFDTLNGS